jgi:hypothetical protein
MRKLKILGLAMFAVFAFAAVSSAAAQADTAHWTIEGATFNGEESVEVEQTTEEFVLASASGIEITCTAVAANGAKIKETNKDSATSLTFTGCKVKSSEAACQVKSSGGTIGTINTAALNSNLLVVTPNVYDVYEPASGTTFTTLVIEKQTGKTCPASGTYTVTGKAAGLIPTTDATTQSLTFNAASATAAGTQLKLGAANATLTGIADLMLSGVNATKSWGVEVTNP